jgi:hypothetical protein
MALTIKGESVSWGKNGRNQVEKKVERIRANRDAGQRSAARVCCRGRGDGGWVREKRVHMRGTQETDSTGGGRTRQGST